MEVKDTVIVGNGKHQTGFVCYPENGQIKAKGFMNPRRIAVTDQGTALYVVVNYSASDTIGQIVASATEAYNSYQF